MGGLASRESYEPTCAATLPTSMPVLGVENSSRKLPNVVTRSRASCQGNIERNSGGKNGRFRESGGSFDSCGVEVEAAEVEEDGVSEALFVPVATCACLDALDLRVDRLAQRIGDLVHDGCEDSA